MDDSTVIAIIGILATLGGALGASWISSRANVKTKQLESKNTLLLARLDRRERLFSKFTDEANGLLLRSIHAPVESVDEFIYLMGLAHQIKLFSEYVGTKALRFADSVVEYHSDEAGKSPKQSSDRLSERRMDFVHECRKELKQFEDQI